MFAIDVNNPALRTISGKYISLKQELKWPKLVYFQPINKVLDLRISRTNTIQSPTVAAFEKLISSEINDPANAAYGLYIDTDGKVKNSMGKPTAKFEAKIE